MKREFTDKGATFSPCRTWRYRLWRVWDAGLPPMAAGMLNPSVADENNPDRTVSNQINRADGMGYGSLVVFNAFSFVSPSPETMKMRLAEGFDIIGPQTDVYTRAILTEVRNRNGLVTVGWGNDGNISGRGAFIAALAAELQIPLFSLGTTASGQPRHPRGVAKSQPYVPWHAPVF